MENTIFLILAIAIILVFVMSIAIIHIRALRDDVNIKWYNLVDTLQYRQDLIPNLIETIRRNLKEDDLSKASNLINQTIEIRSRAAKNSESGSKKIVVEHDISRHIKDLMALEKVSEELARDTNFLELKKEFANLQAGDKLFFIFNGHGFFIKINGENPCLQGFEKVE